MVAGALVAATILSFSGFVRPLLEPLSRPIGIASSAVRRLGVGVLGASNGKVPLEGDSNLSQTVEELRIENAKLKTLVAENEALKSALDYYDRKQDELVLARVIFETDGDILNGLVIDRGLEDGLSEGMPVLVGDGVITGKVFEVRKRSSTVMLLSDTRSRLAVSVQNGVDTVGVLEGDRGLSMHINLIPQTEMIKVGDTVVTSGLEAGVTRGLLVGTVERVDRSDENPFQSAVVTPFSQHYRPSFVQLAVGWDDEDPGADEQGAEEASEAGE
jgi:rod shape-determining protein MreC